MYFRWAYNLCHSISPVAHVFFSNLQQLGSRLISFDQSRYVQTVCASVWNDLYAYRVYYKILVAMLLKYSIAFCCSWLYNTEIFVKTLVAALQKIVRKLNRWTRERKDRFLMLHLPFYGATEGSSPLRHYGTWGHCNADNYWSTSTWDFRK